MASSMPMRYSTRRGVRKGMVGDMGQITFTSGRKEEGGEGTYID